MEYNLLTAEELLGPLNEVEKECVPGAVLVAGDTSLIAQGARVSIVGACDGGSDGMRRVSRMASALAKKRIVLVIGLTDGIDAAAYASAIKHQGSTITVIGTSVDQVCPTVSAVIQQRIDQDHLVISELTEVPPVRYTKHSMGYRTMALISDAIIIIGASDASGCLEQGWQALRLGRRVFLTESAAADPGLAWPEQMLHYGARVLTDDSLEELFVYLPVRSPIALYDQRPF